MKKLSAAFDGAQRTDHLKKIIRRLPMNTRTLSRFRLFGKAGRLVMTVLSIVAALITVFCGLAAAYVARLPEDALTVRVVEHTELRFNAERFAALWGILGGSFSYSGSGGPDQLFGDETTVTPPEDQEFQTELKLFDRFYDSARLHSDGGSKVMEAEAAPAEYNAKKLVAVFVLAALFAASSAGALWMLRGLFAVLTQCDSPFCGDVVARLRSFGFSLLPVAVFASASDTLTGRFLSAGKGGVSIQWGILLAFVVTMALVAVFRYGVQLQKESDETL